MSSPIATPDATPITPITAPWIMKIFMMEPGDAPSVRRIAMSDCFSVTVITRVDTSPNAPTSTMRKRMIDIIRFSTCTAANHVLFSTVQSRAKYPGGSDFMRLSATAGASCISATRTRTPIGPPVRKSAAASSIFMKSIVESYSKCPAVKIPDTVSVRTRGIMPAGVVVP